MNKIEKAKMDVLERLRAASEENDLPNVIRISTYADNKTLARFRPTEEWPGGAAEHERAMLDIAAAISREFPNIKIDLVAIDEEEYQWWLDSRGEDDSPAMRARYISETREEER